MPNPVSSNRIMMCSRKMEREKPANMRAGSRKMGRATSVRWEAKSREHKPKSLEGYVERGLFDSRLHKTTMIILNEESASVLTATIFAWSFLLTAIDGWNLDNKYWQGAMSYLLNLLKREESVRAACVDALAIIFEKNCVEKFSIEAYKAFVHSAINKVDTNMDQKQWKTDIVEQIKEACNQNWEIVRLFEVRLFEVLLGFIYEMKFIKQFLGDGFEVHMQENELLHQVFDVTPKNNPSGSELYVAEIEEVKVKYFSPHIKKSTCKQIQQRFEKSPNSLVSKARTQFMKKQRMLAQEKKIDDFRD
ncbi:unnamed protein product [Camellia sinensis]